MALSRALQTELTDPSLVARPIALDPGVAATDVDAENATAMGHRSKVDLVLVGAVLQATTSHSSKGGSIPFIKSQTGDLRIQSMKAHVALMGQLYNVATGELVATLKASGDHSDSKVSGDAYTSLGSWGGGSDGSFMDSTLGKALQAAIVDLAAKVTAAVPPPRRSAAIRPLLRCPSLRRPLRNPKATRRHPLAAPRGLPPRAGTRRVDDRPRRPQPPHQWRDAFPRQRRAVDAHLLDRAPLRLRGRRISAAPDCRRRCPRCGNGFFVNKTYRTSTTGPRAAASTSSRGGASTAGCRCRSGRFGGASTHLRVRPPRRSSGSGKTIVVFFSAPISTSVCR